MYNISLSHELVMLTNHVPEQNEVNILQLFKKPKTIFTAKGISLSADLALY